MGNSTPRRPVADFAKLNAGLIHPLTGPVFIKGAKPGDLLEVEFVDIRPESFAFTCIVPGLGFLPDVFSTPFLVKWKIESNFATSEQLPGVRIPGAPFMGVSGVAPSKDKLKEWTKRENERWILARSFFRQMPAAQFLLREPLPPKDCEPFHLANAAEISM